MEALCEILRVLVFDIIFLYAIVGIILFTYILRLRKKNKSIKLDVAKRIESLKKVFEVSEDSIMILSDKNEIVYAKKTMLKLLNIYVESSPLGKKSDIWCNLVAIHDLRQKTKAKTLGYRHQLTDLPNQMINLWHNLGIKVLVEGIENERMADLLEIYGCDLLQGYYFAKPLPAFEFQKLLR